MVGGVSGEFGGTQDHVICPRAVVEDCAQVSADGADVLGGAGVGGLGGALREDSGCWGVHGSSLRLVRDLCSLERTLSHGVVQ